MTLLCATLELYLEERHPGWVLFHYSLCPNDYIIRNFEHLFLYLLVDSRQRCVITRSRKMGGDISKKYYTQWTVLDCVSEGIQAIEIVVSEAKNVYTTPKGD